MTKIEGHWNNSSNQYPEYPMPVHSDVNLPDKAALMMLISLSESVATVKRYRGFSRCRCCGVVLGCIEFNLRDWKWPCGFKHYVEVHNVRPTTAFIKEVLGQTTDPVT